MSEQAIHGPFQCTSDTPWTGQVGRVEHDAAHEVSDSQEDGYPGGDIVTMRCDNCGHVWKKELPQ